MCIATADQKDQKNRTKKRRINYQAMQVKKTEQKKGE